MKHKQDETCYRSALLKLRHDMNLMHANMGGEQLRACDKCDSHLSSVWLY